MTDVGNRTDLMDPSRQAGEPPADQYGQGGRPTAVPQRRREIPNMLTERPSEPVQAGLPSGPGPGPSGLRRSDKTLTELQALVSESGDPQLAVLVGRIAGRRG